MQILKKSKKGKKKAGAVEASGISNAKLEVAMKKHVGADATLDDVDGITKVADCKVWIKALVEAAK